MRSSLGWLSAAAKEFATELVAEAQDFRAETLGTAGVTSASPTESPGAQQAGEVSSTGYPAAAAAGTRQEPPSGVGITAASAAAAAAAVDDDVGWDDDEEEGTGVGGTADTSCRSVPFVAASGPSSSTTAGPADVADVPPAVGSTMTVCAANASAVAVAEKEGDLVAALRRQVAELQKQLQDVSAERQKERAQYEALLASYKELEVRHEALQSQLSRPLATVAAPAEIPAPAAPIARDANNSSAEEVLAVDATEQNAAANPGVAVPNGATAKGIAAAAAEEEGGGWSSDDN